jgi:3-oxoacyl-[acyl-carrier protein] reductase
MTIDLSGKVVIVTGGGRGLGRAMTLALTAAGADVIAAGHIPHDIEPIRHEVSEQGKGRCHAMLADVRKPDNCERVVQAALDRFGRLDVLINNAGLGMTLVSPTYTSNPPKFWTVTPDAWRSIMDTNANGPFNMARAAAPHMIRQKWGRIVNVTTRIETMQRRGQSPYGPSKAALEAASAAWAADLEGTGVTVNVLIPGGATDTDMLPGRKGDPDRTGTGQTILSPDVMKAPIVWLASGESDGVTGRRFIAKEWDPAVPAHEAWRKASNTAGFAEWSDG